MTACHDRPVPALYLRSGSLNPINGMVGLTFSCDGTSHLRADGFLARDERFRLGV